MVDGLNQGHEDPKAVKKHFRLKIIFDTLVSVHYFCQFGKPSNFQHTEKFYF